MMKKITFLLFLISYCLFLYGQSDTSLNAATYQQLQYGIRFTAEDVTSLNKKSIKKAVIQFILEASKDTTLYSSNNGKILSFLPLAENKDASILPDTICGTFTITSIIKKNNNYIVKNNKLFKTTMFIVDVSNNDSIGNQNIQYIRILIFQHSYPKKFPILKTRHQYKFTLKPFFHNNCCDYIVSDDGIIVVPLRQSRSRNTYIINGVLVPYFNFYNYNIVEIVDVEQIK